MSQPTATDVRPILQQAVEHNASDVHLVAGYPPVLRVNGVLQAMNAPSLTADHVREYVAFVMPAPMHGKLGELRDVDFSYAIEDAGRQHRFRVNVFQNQQTIGACFRLIPDTIPSMEWAGFPEPLADRILGLRDGLVLVTGVTGAGKSTTLAILIDRINRNEGRRIITVEEPIEYVFSRDGNSVVTQREVGVDVPTFYDGLKYGLRQDPDVILVGEIRDAETARMALSAAETGHLVFATMHTRDAKGAISRFADLFPRNAQDDVRSQLSLSLRFVVSQHLVPGLGEDGRRVLAIEVMANNHGVASAIRLGKIESLETAIQTGKRDGMVTLDETLSRLMRDGLISRETATKFAKDPDHIR